MHRARAFTLLELMIGIAILAIVLAVPRAARDSVQGLTREADYRFALRNARHQQDLLRRTPFAELPPRVVKVPPDGTVQVEDLVPGSLAFRTLDGRPLEAVEPGQEVVVDYRFYLPDRGEAHTVPKTPPHRIPLVNTPAVRLEGVRAATGDALAPVEGARLDESRTGVLLPAALAGRVAVVDYLGERVRNQVSGRFLTEDLQPSEKPTGIKLLRLQESYGEGGGTMSLSLLRVKP